MRVITDKKDLSLLIQVKDSRCSNPPAGTPSWLKVTCPSKCRFLRARKRVKMFSFSIWLQLRSSNKTSCKSRRLWPELEDKTSSRIQPMADWKDPLYPGIPKYSKRCKFGAIANIVETGSGDWEMQLVSSGSMKSVLSSFPTSGFLLRKRTNECSSDVDVIDMHS